MRILLSSTSILEVVFRLVLLLVNLRVVGDVYFRRSRLTHTARIQIGLGVAFIVVFVGTLLQQGQPGMITPVLLGLHLVAGWGSLLARVMAWFRRARDKRGVRWRLALSRLRTSLWNAIPYGCVLLTLASVVYADWPRWVPLTSDPQQHAFFARKILDYHCIPKALVEMGNGTLGYPAGTGIIGFLAFTYSGLLPVETVSLLNGLFLTLCSLSLVDVARRASVPVLYRGLLAFVPFMPGIGGFGAWIGLGGCGKMVAFWLMQSWLIQLLLMRRNRAMTPTLVQFALLLVLGAELNPTLAFMWLWLVVLSFVIWRRDGGLDTPSVVGGFLVVGAGLLLMVLADPFYGDALRGTGAVTPTFSHLPKEAMRFRPAGILDVPAKFGEHVQSFLERSPRPPLVLLFLVTCILVGARGYLRRLDRRRLYVGLLLGFSPSLLLVFIASFLKVPIVSGLHLVPEYSMQVLTLTLWMAAFILAVWWLPRVFDWPASHLYRRVWVTASAALVLPALVTFGILPHLSRRDNPKKSGITRVNVQVPHGLKEATQAVAQLWAEDHDAKVLFVNWEWTRSKPERWIMPEHYSSVVALVRNSNPAFFFYKGSRDYSYDNYLDKVCHNWDPEWLLQRGIRWVLVPPRRSIMARCRTLRAAAEGGHYSLREVASIAPR